MSVCHGEGSSQVALSETNKVRVHQKMPFHNADVPGRGSGIPKPADTIGIIILAQLPSAFFSEASRFNAKHPALIIFVDEPAAIIFATKPAASDLTAAAAAAAVLELLPPFG